MTQPASADDNCQAAVPNVMGGASVSDNCSAPGEITLSQSPAPGTLVGLGSHTITVTATDAAGNSASCTTTFTVSDNKAPTVICSATQPASADDNCQAAVPNVMGGASVSDNCSAPGEITLSQSPAPGTLVGLGSHTITVTATDAAGNSASCTTTFTVSDNKAPTVICSATQPASADDNCQAAVPNVMGGASVSDNCSAPGEITLSQSPAPGTLVGPGSHTITVTATDTAGNSATCSTTFTVSDTKAPTVICSATQPAGADDTCQAAVPNVMGGASVSDNCSAPGEITLSQSPAPGTLVGLGAHTITVTATDTAGNSATCSTTFTVSDTKAPTVICSATQPASADDNCQAAVPNVMGGASVSDNCSAPSAITLSQSPAPGTLVGLGTHTITVTATDAAGNSATCTTTFTVTDKKAPTVICSATQPASADDNCQAPVPNVMGGASVSDNCSAPSALALSQSPAPGTLAGLGIHTITVTATDPSGNSASCTTTFTVTDNTAPTVICSAVAGASADGNCQAAVPNVMSGVSLSDACSAASAITLSQSPAAGTLVGLGTHTITVTATDAAGNSATCTTTFTVTHDTAPTVICPAPTSASAGTNCLAAMPDVLGGVSASDSCSGTNGITLSQSPAAGTLELSLALTPPNT